MAKADEQTILEKNVETLMEAMVELKRQNAAIKAQNDDLTAKVAQLTSQVSLMEQDTLLPAEVREGVTPGVLYCAAVQSFIIGYIGANPALLMKSGDTAQHGERAIARALEFGDNVVKAMQARWGVPREEKKPK